MKRTTRKLSGPAKDRFFASFIAAEAGQDPKLAADLIARCQATFTSVRIRRSVRFERMRARRAITPPHEAQAAPAPAQPPVAPSPPSFPRGPVTDFDAYVFGLTPVYQREGRDGLLGRLEAITAVADLRAMAKAQQIVLPAEFRSGEVEVGALRSAIADAVARRIADRRAAAG